MAYPQTFDKYLYTLGDILAVTGFLGNQESSPILKQTLAKYSISEMDLVSSWIPDGDENPYVTTFFSEYIVFNASKETVVISDNPVNDKNNEDIIAFLERLVQWITRTFLYHKTLLDIYNNSIATLMKQVETDVTGTTATTDGRSDMPQTATFASAPTSDVLSSLQQTQLTNSQTTKQDYGTPMQRIAEIKEHMENVYSEWYDEFVKEFIIA